MTNQPSLSVGFGRVCITPKESVPLGGYGNSSRRMSQNILSDLYSTCVAFSDSEGSTVLLYHNDLGNCNKKVFPAARKAISEAIGLPVERIMLCCTHTHSGPDMGNDEEASIVRYRPWLIQQFIEAAKLALADRKPATAEMGFTETKALNFVRHYIMNDGSIVGDNHGDPTGKEYVGHTTEADPQMRLLKFTREGGKDVLLVNWQSHPHRTGGGKKYDISADIIGAMRDEMEKELGCLFAYYSGGSGNINPHSRIKEENITQDYLEQGKALADTALAALGQLTPIRTGKVQTLYLPYQARVNHTQDHLLEKAKELSALWKGGMPGKDVTKLARPYGLFSPYHCGAVITKADMPETALVEMYAISIGDVAFITAPCEMFDTNAKYIRDNSPFPMTFIVTYANHAASYIPSAYAYTYGCYEADNGRMQPGTGEQMTYEYLRLLRKLYETK